MSNESLIVGYRSEDQSRYFAGAHTKGGRCGDCRCEVFVNDSGIAALRERDSIVYCQNCYSRDPDAFNRSL